jgi:NAD(P)-dependent dehydrogenase (short-subunit alcohol dehydrogenase family)
MHSVKCEWAVITGVAGGIGQHLVNAFRKSGYKVIGIDCVVCPKNLVCEHYMNVDLQTFSADDSYANEITSKINCFLDDSKIRVLINNAAVQILGGVETLSRETWRKTLDVNLIAPFFLTQSLLPFMENGSGNIINISSIHAKLTKRNFVAYATSKAALSGLSRAMAVDLGKRVRINCIEPAAIRTDMLSAGFIGEEKELAKLTATHPQMRIGDPIEIAQLALALSNGHLNFMHGSCISIDGGVGCLLNSGELDY